MCHTDSINLGVTLSPCVKGVSHPLHIEVILEYAFDGDSPVLINCFTHTFLDGLETLFGLRHPGTVKPWSVRVRGWRATHGFELIERRSLCHLLLLECQQTE